LTPDPEPAPACACPFCFLANWKGGLAGVLIYVLASALLFFIAFMVALGNDTPGGRLYLDFFGAWATVSHPLWMIPLSYAAGARWIRRESS
jgi:hypothetical protein